MTFSRAELPLVLMKAVHVQILLKARLFRYPGMNEQSWLWDENSFYKTQLEFFYGSFYMTD